MNVLKQKWIEMYVVPVHKIQQQHQHLEIARIEVAKAGCIQTWSHVTLVVFEDGRTVTCKRRAK
jgi:hypothetical protein